MNVLSDYVTDTLEPLGIGVGAFLVLAALGTIAGAPWATHAAITSAVVQVLGSVLMAILGLGLIYVSWAGGE